MLRPSAYKIKADASVGEQWRGIVLRGPTGGAGEIAWSASDTRASRSCAIRDAEEHLRLQPAKRSN